MFKLFKSSRQRELDRRLRFRRGKSRVLQFLQRAKTASERYHELAQRSLQLGDESQARHLTANYVRLTATINQWERFLIKMESLEMRRDEIAAAGEFTKSIISLATSISRQESILDARTVRNALTTALDRCTKQEESVQSVMEAASESLENLDENLDSITEHIMSEWLRPRTEGEPIPHSSESTLGRMSVTRDGDRNWEA